MKKTKKIEKTIAERIAKHPMYSPGDLKYLRGKGYSDQEILAFWDRDHGLGCKPVQHRFTYIGSVDEVVRDVLKDNLSPEAVAAIAAFLDAATTKNDEVNRQIAWFVGQLIKMVGGDAAMNRLCDEVGL